MKCVPFVLAGSIALGPAVAYADGSVEAEALFQEGMRLVDAGKVAAGCDKLAASYRIEAGFGVLYNLADCHERIGKTATAWTEFRSAVALAHQAGQAERETKAAKRAGVLESRLSRVRVVVAPEAPGNVIVRQDGAQLPQAALGTSLPIDPGTHTFDASAEGKKPWQKTVDIAADAHTLVVDVPALLGESASQEPSHIFATPRTVARETGLGTQRTVALVAGGVGLAGVVLGTVFSLSAKATYDGADCNANNVCSNQGIQDRNAAFSKATVATAGFAVGALGLVGGAVLWLTAPSAKKRAFAAPTARGFTVQGVW